MPRRKDPLPPPRLPHTYTFATTAEARAWARQGEGIAGDLAHVPAEQVVAVLLPGGLVAVTARHGELAPCPPDDHLFLREEGRYLVSALLGDALAERQGYERP